MFPRHGRQKFGILQWLKFMNLHVKKVHEAHQKVLESNPIHPTFLTEFSTSGITGWLAIIYTHHQIMKPHENGTLCCYYKTKNKCTIKNALVCFTCLYMLKGILQKGLIKLKVNLCFMGLLTNRVK